MTCPTRSCLQRRKLFFPAPTARAELNLTLKHAKRNPHRLEMVILVVGDPDQMIDGLEELGPITVIDIPTVGDGGADEAVPDLNVPGRFQSPGIPAEPRSPAGSEQPLACRWTQ